MENNDYDSIIDEIKSIRYPKIIKRLVVQIPNDSILMIHNKEYDDNFRELGVSDPRYMCRFKCFGFSKIDGNIFCNLFQYYGESDDVIEKIISKYKIKVLNNIH